MKVVARQTLSGRFGPFVVGLICLLAAVAMLGMRPFSLGTALFAGWFSLGGAVFVWAGITTWNPKRIVLAIDSTGLWCKLRMRGLSQLGWEEVLGAKAVHWSHPEGEDQGLIIGLAASSRVPFPPRHISFVSAELQKRFGPLPWQSMIMLGGEEWDWDATEAETMIQTALVMQANVGSRMPL
jgi:hypothetical protein